AVRAEDSDARVDAALSAKSSEFCGVGRMKVHQQQILPDCQGYIGWENKIDATADLPGVRRLEAVEQRHGTSRGVEQFDEFIVRVVIGPDIGGVIQDFVNHDGSDAWSGIASAQGQALLGNKVLLALAGKIAAERHPVFSGPVSETVRVPGQIPISVSGKQEDLAAVPL